ncbi:hypothetical protein ACO22_07337 [Paracoccidioides brasiliensis]|uniref:C6 finger domain transcription factor nscR n=1 Tax=Paracoccidioides brasiliensis TaxID=121759 RepID=A0A1D2J4Y8_PARBR|nr:hypothetical protein ACO22_07337 [Paracoccidioides brasiliensis]
MAYHQLAEPKREPDVEDDFDSGRFTEVTIPADRYSSPAPSELPRKKPYLSSGKKITRSRVSKSCLTCRQRKVKCDTVHPICGTCEKTKSACHYSSSSLTDPSQLWRNTQDDSHGIKRRRELIDPVNLGGVSATDVLSPFSILREIQRGQDALREQYSDSQPIVARLDQLIAVVEQWARTNEHQSLEELNISRQNQKHDPSNNGDAGPILLHASESWKPSPDASPLSGPSSKVRLGQTAQAETSGNDDFPIPSGLETDLVDPVGSLNLGHLSLEDGGKSRYVGTTYWAYISREITEPDRLLHHQSRPHGRSPTPSDGYSSVDEDQFQDPTLSTNSHRTKPSHRARNDSFHRSVPVSTGDSSASQDNSIESCMLENVPTRAQSRILYKGFMSGVHAISPVMHSPSILEKYHAFWDWYENMGQSGEPCPDPSFIPLLYAIWYGGSVTISLRIIRDEFDIESRAALSTPFHDEVTRWLRKISFPRNSSIHGLMAFLLVQTILSREEEPLASSLFISLALRVAQSMGLHRDPAQVGISACEAETRRRRSPPLVSDENYWDVRDTSEVKDTLLGSTNADEYERLVNANERKPDRPSDPTICGGAFMVNILKIQLGTKPVTRKDMEVLQTILIELQSKLYTIVDRIPVVKSVRPLSCDGHSYQSAPSCSSSSAAIGSVKCSPSSVGPSCLEQYHSPVLVAFHKWARISLSLFVDKAFCVAYQPFLKNAKSKIWPVARQRALRHCHGFMEKFILLATDPDFQPFQWSWPGLVLITLLSRIMLIDLYERPQTVEAAKFRAFIDKIFSLSGPDGGVVGGEDGISTSRPLRDGGREAWDMMRRLREKAWLKAALDPSVLWTEKAQAEAQRPITKRASAQLPRERLGSTVESFADSYYTLIKEPYDYNSNTNQSSEREGERISGGKGNRQKTGSLHGGHPYSQSQHIFFSSTDQHAIATFLPTQPQWPYSPPAHPQTNDINSQSWPSSSPFSSACINDSSPYQLPPTLSSHTASPPGHPSTNTTTNNPATQALNFPPFTSPEVAPVSDILIPVSTPSDINLDIQPHQLPNPSAPTSSLRFSNLISSPPIEHHNLQFDWDQWDAVFGPSLPVVDGFTHLDTVDVGGAGTGENVGIGGGGGNNENTTMRAGSRVFMDEKG